MDRRRGSGVAACWHEVAVAEVPERIAMECWRDDPPLTRIGENGGACPGAGMQLQSRQWLQRPSAGGDLSISLAL
jgi:hypothetical protein